MINHNETLLAAERGIIASNHNESLLAAERGFLSANHNETLLATEQGIIATNHNETLLRTERGFLAKGEGVEEAGVLELAGRGERLEDVAAVEGAAEAPIRGPLRRPG